MHASYMEMKVSLYGRSSAHILQRRAFNFRCMRQEFFSSRYLNM